MVGFRSVARIGQEHINGKGNSSSKLPLDGIRYFWGENFYSNFPIHPPTRFQADLRMICLRFRDFPGPKESKCQKWLKFPNCLWGKKNLTAQILQILKSQIDDHPIKATESAPPDVQSDMITSKWVVSHQNHHKSDQVQVTIQTYTYLYTQRYTNWGKHMLFLTLLKKEAIAPVPKLCWQKNPGPNPRKQIPRKPRCSFAVVSPSAAVALYSPNILIPWHGRKASVERSTYMGLFKIMDKQIHDTHDIAHI